MVLNGGYRDLNLDGEYAIQYTHDVYLKPITLLTNTSKIHSIKCRKNKEMCACEGCCVWPSKMNE